MREKKEYLYKIIIVLVFFTGIILFFSAFKTNNKCNIWNDYAWHTLAADELSKNILNGQIGSLALKKNMGEFRAILIYPMWHILEQVVKNACEVIGLSERPTIIVALTNGLIITGSLVLMAFIFERKKRAPWWHYMIYASLFICGTLNLSPALSRYYLGGFLPNTWHNPTIIMAKPFGIALFYIYCRILDKGGNKKLYIVATILMALSAFAKPSLYQILIPSLFVYCVINTIIHRNFKVFIKSCYVALTCIPTLLIAILQVLYLSENQNTSMKIGYMKGWRGIVTDVKYPLFSTLFLPIIGMTLAILTKREGKKMILSMLLLIVAYVEFSLLYIPEKISYGDFVWGVLMAVFISYMVTIDFLLNRYGTSNIVEKGLYLLAWLVYGVQVVEGLRYMHVIIQTGSFLEAF